MVVLAWNIQHGGGTRSGRIVDALISHQPDVIALGEFRTKRGGPICGALAESGWTHRVSTGPAGSGNGLCVLSRTPLSARRPCASLPEKSGSWLDVDLPEYGFGIGLLHILCSAPRSGTMRAGEAKMRFWDAVIRASRRRRGEPFLFVGDWNTGAHRLDEPGKTFIGQEHFAKLSATGWTDLWRTRNPDVREWTWYSKFKGGARANGFRLDHAFASPCLSARVTSCRYSHDEREAGISDHSILLVEVDGKGAAL